MAAQPKYVTGTPHPNTNRHASVRTKPTTQYTDTRVDTGGGYERIRSYEFRPHTARSGKEDVYASIHRLCAVAWCYPEDMAVGEILTHLAGRDVHHTTGVEWCNVGESPNFDKPGLEVREHGSHSRITQAQMRAYAADSKRSAKRDPELGRDGKPDCDRCGASDGTLCTTAELDRELCLECMMDYDPDGAIEVL